jgi:hypothetical protein
MPALVSILALVALVPTLATVGAHVLKRGVFVGGPDLRRARAMGVALIVSSFWALMLIMVEISFMTTHASAPMIALLRGAVVLGWVAGVVLGWRNLAAASERGLYTAAASLAITWWLLQDNAVSWADALCFSGLAVWLVSVTWDRSRAREMGH